MCKDGAAAEATVSLGDAERLVEELADLEEYYFGGDKEAKKQQSVEQILKLLDAEAGANLSGAERARMLYLKGRLSLFAPVEGCDCQEVLSKAIKLDPTLLGAWNALGEAHWNKQEYTQARRCFEEAIERCGPNATSLRNLSMVLRVIDDSENRSANFALSVAKAKEAVALDTSGGQTWETLGNAYLGDFFVNGCQKADELSKSLIAYDKAEAAYQKSGKLNPSIYMNRGTVLKFLQNYDMAIQSFQKAQEISGSEPAAAAEARKLVDLVKRITDIVTNQGRIKTKRLNTLLQTVPKSIGSKSLKELQRGENKGAVLDAKVVQLFDRSNEVPIIAICSDAAGNFFALSVYNADFNAISQALVPMEASFSVSCPHLREISMTRGEEHWSYPCVRIAHPQDIDVVGLGKLGHAAVMSSVKFS